ncbi:MAG: tyrosine-type recombinase/integrase [Motiliproteus sp.]|nr:tyrosine-type recombinase/integrase [Motiliproteus sp.]MCW9051280.1 tyrosine-type recombinase/integrase [Motiliproteus sp.]
MNSRPRKNNLGVPNLYLVINKKTGQIKYRYKNILSGKFKMLKTRSREEAIIKAQQLNAIIAQKLLDREAAAILEADNSQGITVAAWIDQFVEIQKHRAESGEIKTSTYDNARWKLNPVKEKCGRLKLGQFNTLRINEYLHEKYVVRDKKRMAQAVRSRLIEVFKEAVAAGHFPADKPNPAEVAKTVRVKVKRSRLTLDVFNKAMEWAQKNQPEWQWRSYQLALLTAQRLTDVGGFKFADIRKDNGIEYLGIVQGKGGNRLMIPMDLHLEAINWTLRDIVSACRNRVVSPYLLHHTKHVGRAKPGQQVRSKSLSNGFAEAIRAVKKDWGEYNPPSFHELRSLSERLFEEQGINTQHLLGHKHKTTTDTYHDARGHDWIKVKIS